VEKRRNISVNLGVFNQFWCGLDDHERDNKKRYHFVDLIAFKRIERKKQKQYTQWWDEKKRKNENKTKTEELTWEMKDKSIEYVDLHQEWWNIMYSPKRNSQKNEKTQHEINRETVFRSFSETRPKEKIQV
jgi:hypothetical protein